MIDPTLLRDFDGWVQSDYHQLWIDVIKTYARKVIFLDGWMYSVGCVWEYLAALERGFRP